MNLNITIDFLLSTQIRAGPQPQAGAGPPAHAGPTEFARISQQQKVVNFFSNTNVRRSTMQYFKKLKATGILFALVMFAAGMQTAMAVGTASNTTIANTATVDYQVSGFAQATVTSNNETFLVDNRVDLTVANVAGTNVLPSSTDQPLTFTVTNTGNTTQGYALTATNGAGDFNMGNIRIYIDDGDNIWEGIGTETLYVAATNAFDLAANATSVNVYVVADTPGTPTNGQTSDIDLLATTLNAGTTTVTTGLTDADPNTAGVDVVFGDAAGTVDIVEDGQHSAVGTYTIAITPLTLVKSSVVAEDPFNGTTNPKAIPGARITYTLLVTNPGATDATTVVVVDDIPANTTYVAESITLGGAAQTDAEDSGVPVDNSDWNVTNPGAITVNVGTLGAAASVTITFDVTIN